MDDTATWAAKLSASNKRTPRRKRFRMEGMRIGRLLVLEWVGKSSYRCRCDCGNETIAKGWRLRHGEKQSCGCLQLEVWRRECAALRQRRTNAARARREGPAPPPPCDLALALGYSVKVKE